MSILKKAGLSLAVLLCASASSIALASDQVIILTDNTSAGSGLSARLVAAGYNVTVTQNPIDVSGDLSGYKQVWDVRLSPPLGTGEVQSYTSYLNNAGGLFLLGENSSFAIRNNSIIDFTVAVGGGNVVYGGGLVTSQYVTSIFNGNATVVADDATSFYVPAAGTFSSAGNGVFITTAGPGGTGQGTGIAFSVGTLTNAPSGRLLTYLDVNTFQAGSYTSTPALQNLIDRMIGFVAGSVQLPGTGSGPAVIDRSQSSFDLDSAAANGATISFNGGTLNLTGGTVPDHVVTADVDIDTDGAFVNTAGNSGTFTGTVSGDGGLIVSGGGTLGLTGTNSYSGGTIISDSSTVEVGSRDALGTGNIVLMDGRLRATGSLDLDQSVSLASGVNAIDTGANSLIINGDLSGTGGFVKNGTGTLTLTGTSSYTGGTFIQSGTLAGDTNSLTGNVVNNGSLVFDQQTAGTFGGAVSGTGGLTLKGGGTLTLTGASNYTGGTFIQSGTLVGDTNSLTGNVVNDGDLVFDQQTAGTFGGAVSGTGGLTLKGGGTLTLTGTSTYAGGTFIQSGTLVGDTNSLTGNVVNDGSLVFDQQIAGTFGGAVSGTGGLTLNGGGALTLTGASTYTGGTFIQSGTLTGDTNSLTGNVVNNGSLVFNQQSAGTFGGAVSGAGSLIVSGGGTLGLTGTNTYTGGTLVSGNSTVIISDADALGTGNVTLSNGRLNANGPLKLTQSVTLIGGANGFDTGASTIGISGAISGTGGFVKSGSGTLILTGANSYTGGTLVQVGTLVGDTSSLVGPVTNNGTLVFNQGSTGVFGETISGTGGFVKQGTASLNLTGASSYSGATVIEAGRLAINGSVVNSQVLVEAGGTVGGNGIVGSLIVRTNATAAPGNSIGQLRAATSVLFEAGSVYQVEANAAGQSDRIMATGVSTLQGGTVQVIAETGSYRPQTRYEILTASRIDGQFAAVTSNLAFLLPTLSYSATGVTLTLTRNDIAFADVAATANQRATATAINASFAPGNPLYYAIVGASAEGAQASFDHLSGEVHASALSVAAQDADALRRSVLGRLAEPAPEGLSMWTELAASWSKLHDGVNAGRVKSETQGFRAGIEQNYGSVRIGIAGGYNDGDLRIDQRASHGDVNTAHAAVYGGVTMGSVSLRAGAGYSWLDLKTDRTATANQLSQQLKAKYKGSIAQVFGEAGYKVATPVGSVEPFAGVNALWLRNDAFTEQFGSFALNGAKERRDYVWSTVGVRSKLALGKNSRVSLSLTGGWQHALNESAVASTMAFAAGGPAFTVEGAPLARNAALIDAGLGWAVTKSLRFGLSYIGTLADQRDTHTGQASLSLSF